MNLDLLIKLVKLANNNPNDNEANLAARKVCKIIAENDYKFTATKTAAQKVGVNANKGTWNDVTRSTEPMWSSKPPRSYNQEASQRFWDIFNDIRENAEKGREHYGVDWGESPYEPKRKTQSKQSLCNRCKWPFTVSVDINSETFICTFCKLKEKNDNSPTL